MNSEDSIDVSEKHLTFIELYNSWRAPIKATNDYIIEEDEIKYMFTVGSSQTTLVRRWQNVMCHILCPLRRGRHSREIIKTNGGSPGSSSAIPSSTSQS